MLFRPIVLFALFSFLLFVSCQDGDTSSSSTTDASSTSESSTSSSEAPCEDSPNTDCSSFKSYCTNDKYIPLLKSFCPVTCNLCPGATTVEPPTDSPNCYDSSSNCVNWVKNGFCSNCFYKCTDRIKYCAKSCGFCSPGSCKDCHNVQNFMKFIEEPIMNDF